MSVPRFLPAPRFPGPLLAAAVVLLTFASGLVAQEASETIQFHGFGNWKYARTNRNQYLGGSRIGDYRTLNFDLNIAAHPLPRLSLVAQVGFDESEDGSQTDLAYSFAEWKVSDALRLRAGKIQHPFGIYTEVFDVGTLRPFLTLPQAIYGPVGIVSEAFEGVALRGRRGVGGGWMLAYDVYGGGISVAEDERPLQALRGAVTEVVAEESNRDVIGGRLVVHTPVDGLSVGSSFYTGVHDSAGQSSRETIVGGQVDYTSDRLWLRAEAVHNSEVNGPSMDAGYVEVAWFVLPRLQIASQYNRLDARLPGVDPALAPWLTRHEEGAIGIGFWATAELAIKASFHLVHGNRLAFPDKGTAAEFLDPALGRGHTRLFQAGVQFSF